MWASATSSPITSVSTRPFNYVGYDRYSGFGIEGGHSLWTGLANAYVDLGTVIGITPYIGGGVGIAHARTAFDAGINAQPGFGYNQTGFAYALNAGVAYQVTDNASVDVGYQYLSAPNLRRFDYATEPGAPRYRASPDPCRPALRTLVEAGY